jgi:hypothetical protein
MCVLFEPWRRPLTGEALGFSLFYFADDGEAEGDRYHLLMEGARFADEHGLAAVRAPERHFHHFGGLFPNPSVTGRGGGRDLAGASMLSVPGGAVPLGRSEPRRTGPNRPSAHRVVGDDLRGQSGAEDAARPATVTTPAPMAMAVAVAQMSYGVITAGTAADRPVSAAATALSAVIRWSLPRAGSSWPAHSRP